MTLLLSYDFLVVAIGTMILSISSAMVGCISLHKGQSLIGDAVGHASFPGIVFAFMLFRTRDPLVLSLGALTSGAISYALIQGIFRGTKVKLDAALAIFLSGFFGLGMVLKSHIQGNSDYAGASQSGLGTYIFGQASYMMMKDIYLITGVAVIALGLLLLFYKEMKIFIFDEDYARSIGYNVGIMYAILLLMIMSLIAVGLKVVGAILISSLLVIPAVTANQWSDHFGVVLFVSGFVGAIAAFCGTLVSSLSAGMSTGPTIILIMGILALISMVIGKRGAVARYLKRRKL